MTPLLAKALDQMRNLLRQLCPGLRRQRWPGTLQPPWRGWTLAMAEACRHGWPPQAMRPPRAGCAARAAATCAPRNALLPGPDAKAAQARWPHAGSRAAGPQA